MQANAIQPAVEGVFVASAVAAMLTGIAISLIMSYSAGPHREPLWLAVVISVLIGVTITTVVYVLKESSALSIWQVMLLGGGCGALGARICATFQYRRKPQSTPSPQI